ncbi:MAG TPA: hypothetical protein VMF87_02600 [Streptosporangiaceae bacterium]|nr:hypothetical protein [Streptosporangiaceae bacterium]HTX26463.1 hypothetical protein [Streptosporangiaceae bacterium]
MDTATQVVPIAKNAGMAARQSAEDAAAWAAPRVQDARAWAAPQLEQAGVAVRDKIAPAISEKLAPAISAALVDAAHRLDDSVPAARRRRWPRVLGGFAMIAAVCSAVAAVVMRRRPEVSTFGVEDQATMPNPGPGRGTAAASDNGDDTTSDGQMPSS